MLGRYIQYAIWAIYDYPGLAVLIVMAYSLPMLLLYLFTGYPGVDAFSRTLLALWCILCGFWFGVAWHRGNPKL